MELRKRLSNPEVADTVVLAGHAVAGDTLEDAGNSASSPTRATCPWRLVDRLGKEIVTELVAGKRAGVTKRVLAERYDISLSSVKRILKTNEHLAR